MFSQKTDKAIDTGKYFFLLNLPIQLRIRQFAATIFQEVRCYDFNVVSDSLVRLVFAENRIRARNYLDMAKIFIEPSGSTAN